MQLSGSTLSPVDVPLEGVEHGRIQMEIKLRDQTDGVQENEETGRSEALRETEESSPVVEVKDLQSTANEEETESVTSSASASASVISTKENQDSSLVQDMSQVTLGDLNSSTEVDHNRSVDRTPPRCSAAKDHKKPAQSPSSYSSKAENDDVMMVMIRALQDEVEDWKLKYSEMKLAHDTLVAVTVSHLAS
jgi:hypothetical protein